MFAENISTNNKNPLQKAKYNYSTWKDINPWGGTKIIELCLFRFQIKHNEIIHEYYDRRARLIEYCRDLRNKWKKLTKNQKDVCFHGYFNFAENNNFIWTWNKIKTKLGCDSLFEGDCDWQSFILNRINDIDNDLLNKNRPDTQVQVAQNNFSEELNLTSAS